MIPPVTVRRPVLDEPLDDTQVRWLCTNPVFAGIWQEFYPGLVSEEIWIEANAAAIRQEGAQQWLTNLLAILREEMRPR